MVSRENITREVLSDLEARRAQNLMEEKRRKQEVSQMSPVIAQLLSERQKKLFSGIRSAFASPAKANEISSAMQRDVESINFAIKQELGKIGKQEDYLQPVYTCSACRDTGYVGELIHEQCACLRRAVMAKLYQNEGLQGLERENFSTFNEQVFPDELVEGRKNTQRGYIRKIRAHCEAYADGFDPRVGKGMLFCGTSGLGKTFLMNCIAQRVLERGYSVVIISAYKLIEIMRRYQFEGEQAERVQDMLSCDLLCIDDLGSEPMLRNITVSSLYHIINERRNANRSMLVTTNLDSDALYELYDDRIGARLTDPSRMQIIQFVGQDVRPFVRG